MPAYEVINDDGSVSIRVDENTVMGPYSSAKEAMRAILPIIIANNEKIDAAFQRLIALEQNSIGRRPTVLPPEAA
jgi:hypothetical protein